MLSSSRLVALLLLVVAAPGARAALVDPFNDTSINLQLWDVVLPFGDSSLVEQGGAAVFTNRAGLVTDATFTGNVDIIGRFQLTGNSNDQFKIVTRTHASQLTSSASSTTESDSRSSFSAARSSTTSTSCGMRQRLEFLSAVQLFSSP